MDDLKHEPREKAGLPAESVSLVVTDTLRQQKYEICLHRRKTNMD